MRIDWALLRIGLLIGFCAGGTSPAVAQWGTPPGVYTDHHHQPVPSYPAPVAHHPATYVDAGTYHDCPHCCPHCLGSHGLGGHHSYFWYKLKGQIRRHLRWHSHINSYYEECPPPCEPSYGYMPTRWRRLPESGGYHPPVISDHPASFGPQPVPNSGAIPAPAPMDNAPPQTPQVEPTPMPPTMPDSENGPPTMPELENGPPTAPPTMDVQFQTARVDVYSKPVKTTVYRSSPVVSLRENPGF